MAGRRKNFGREGCKSKTSALIDLKWSTPFCDIIQKCSAMA